MWCPLAWPGWGSCRPHGQGVVEVNQDEIIAMANEAGLNSYRIAPSDVVAVWGRFAALVAAKEREACAQVCDGFDTGRRLTTDYKATEIAAAIRARGQKEGA